MVSAQKVQEIEDNIYAITERIDQMHQQLTQQLAGQNLSNASHQQLHAEVVELRKLSKDVEHLKTRGSGGHGSGGSDKSLIPDVYSLDKSKWPQWSLRFRRFMDRRHPGTNLKANLEKVERMTAPLSTDYIASTGVDDYVSNDLIDYLTAKTDDEAGTIIRGSQNDHGLEAWRKLAASSEPQGTYTELRETRLITRPNRCHKPSDLAGHFADWENRLLKLTTRTGNSPITPEGKRWAVLDMVP